MRRLDLFAKFCALAGVLAVSFVVSVYAQDAPVGQVKPLDSAGSPERPATPYAPKPGAAAPRAQQPAADAQPEASPERAPIPVPASVLAPAPAPAMAPVPLNAAEPQTSGRAKSQRIALPSARPQSVGGRLTLGALLPLTGPLGASGQMSKAAIDLAVEDVNAYLAAGGSPGRISVQTEDTAGNEATAQSALKSLAASGVRLVIGPYSDDEVDGVLDLATANDILLLSQGSAGPYLGKPGRGNLLRFAPSDAYQAEAIAALASQEGATHLITIWSGNRYGDELVTHIKGQFSNLQGQVIAGTRFKPATTQFAGFVADLRAQIDKVVKDKTKLAIVVAARGDQTAAILREAAKIPALADAKWYGSDSAALSSAITQDPEAAKFVAQTRMAFARYGETGTLFYSGIAKRIGTRVQAPADAVDARAVVAYDITWLAAMSALTANAPTKQSVSMLVERTYGASGWMALNENGDRRENYDFDFWTIQNSDWVIAARYQSDPGNDKQLLMNRPEK